MFSTAATVVMLFAFLACTPRMVGYLRRYVGTGLVTTMYPERARTIAVKLAPGSYVAGTTLGQIANLTARSDVQNITVSNANGGGFLVGFNNAGQVTYSGNIAYNANAAVACSTIQSAIVTSLGEIANSSITVVQNSTGNFSVTFGGNLANMPQANLTAVNYNLTGANALLTTTHPITGQYPGGGWTSYSSAATDGTATAKALLQSGTVVDALGRHVGGGGEWGESSWTAPAFVSGYFRTVDLTGIDSTAVGQLGHLIVGNTSNLTNPAAVLSVSG